MTFFPPHASDQVVIVGGGFAGLETLLALRAMADDRIPVTLIAPDASFYYRPAATIEAFDFDDEMPRVYALEEIAADLGATFQRGKLESVGTERRYVRLSYGGRLHYDHLVLALGTRARARIPGALTFRDQRDLPLFRGLLQDLDAGAVRRLVFALPPTPTYPVPLYELALLSAAHVAARGLDATVTVVSPEAAPLSMFGDKPSVMVGELLAERGITFIGGTVPAEVRGDGALVVSSGDPIPADRVVAVPQLRGQRVTGIPSTPSGFIPTDGFGQVESLTDVYAAGDITTYPVKQAGLATQQADRIAQRILEAVGIATPEVRRPRVLQAQLVGGDHPLFLWAELDDHGRGTAASLGHVTQGATDAHDKVFARYLKPYLRSFRQRVGAPVAV